MWYMYVMKNMIEARSTQCTCNSMKFFLAAVHVHTHTFHTDSMYMYMYIYPCMYCMYMYICRSHIRVHVDCICILYRLYMYSVCKCKCYIKTYWSLNIQLHIAEMCNGRTHVLYIIVCIVMYQKHIKERVCNVCVWVVSHTHSASTTYRLKLSWTFIISVYQSNNRQRVIVIIPWVSVFVFATIWS